MKQAKETIQIKRVNLTTKLTQKLSKEKKTSRYGDPYIYQPAYFSYCNRVVPGTFEYAMVCNEAGTWKEAMNHEMESLERNEIWTLMNRPYNKNILDVKWVYKKNTRNIFKAKLVVAGYQQEEIIDSTYSPVLKMQTLKLLLSYYCQNSLSIEQMAVETAFLNGKVNSEVYAKQASGYTGGSNKVYKLYKSLYGLKKSPRCWYECFNCYGNKIGFQRSNYDSCLYAC